VPEIGWTPEAVNPNASSSSGKISDLFKNEGVEDRGHFTEDAPSFTATLMAREVIQNSWDAARELRRDNSALPTFELDFEFRAVAADEKQHFVDALGLRGLAEHAGTVGRTPAERQKVLGLAADDCLRHISDSDPLRYCTIVERGASGMYGSWQTAESRMYLAMSSIGYTEKPDGSGGTFGYGKAGLIRASRPRIVIAYSCFREQSTDPGITRRLLGMAYWGRHKIGGTTYTGFVRFGNTLEDGNVEPFENEMADAVAESLGLDVRSPEALDELGTTFIVLDPLVSPEELRVAVERNWWPALVEGRFSVLIRDGDREIPCRPKTNPQLEVYIEAYELIDSGGSPGGTRKASIQSLGNYQPAGADNLPLGQLALIADPEGWSFPDELGADDEVQGESRSLVALMREPRMIVEYYLPGSISRRVPYVRGVFLASPEVNAELAKTEPKAHDKWDTHESDDVPTEATKYAREIATRIRAAVKRFQDELRPPVDDSSAIRLHRLDEKLARLRNQQGKNPPPPPPGDRPYRFTLDVRREERDQELVVSGNVDVRLADDVTVHALPTTIRIALAIDEDGKRGTEVPLNVVPPRGFTPVDGDGGRFEGTLTGAPVRFEVKSEPYRADWTGQLVVSGERVESDGEVER
jgi:hypothetical protein